MNAKQTLPAVALLLDDCRGIYIPCDFVREYDVAQWGIHPGSWAATTCDNPESDEYWDAWQEILDTAKFEEDGYTWTLYQDGDLWALCPELMTSEELKNFGFDPEMVEERKCQELIAELKEHSGVKRYAETWILDDTVHGDYCGGYVQMANYETLNEEHGHYLETRHEGYGSTMLIFADSDLATATSDELKSLIDSLDRLQDYPVLDEERWSRLEFEAALENWESWGRSDFRKALEKRFDINLDDLSDERLDATFERAREKANEDWRQDGDGLTMYIDIDRIAEAVDSIAP